jgi:hypothetical protein
MADNTMDRLEIEVQAQASKANAELEKLVGKLERVSGSLSKINASGLQGLANGVQKLSISMQGMSNVKTADFSRLAKNIEKLGSIDQAKINGTASALRTISSVLTASTGFTSGATQITELANSISRLGYKSASTAITNIPLMANALRGLMQTLATSPNVSKNLIDMTNALANLSNQGSKVRSATNSINGSLKKYSSSAKQASANTRNFSLSLAGLYAKLWLVRRAIGLLSGSIKKSMDFGETINLFQTSFKKIGVDTATDLGMEMGSAASEEFAKGFIDRAKAFNEKITDALSLDPEMMMKYQAVFAQMSNSMGLTAESAMNVSESLTLLGNDIASLWNIDTADAMTKLQSGLAGQIRPLRELGVDISKTSLEMYALKYGIKDSVENMSQAAKVQLRWLAIMEQTEVAFGDMAKTIDSPANQLRILSQQWTNLTRSIGNVFLPIVTTVLPYINALVIALRRMVDTLATAMGFELPDYTDTNIYTDVTGDIEGIGDGADETKDSVDSLKKSLMSFDSLNILSKGKTKGIGLDVGSGYGELDDAINEKTASYMAKFNEELEKMSNKADTLADGIERFFSLVGDKVRPTTEAFKTLWNEGLSKLGGFVGDNLVSFYKNFLSPVGTWTLGVGLPSLFETANNLLNDIDWKTLNQSFTNLYKALSPFAISIGTGLINFVDGLVDILTPAVKLTVDGFSKALNGLATIISLIPESTAIAIGGAIGGIATAFLIFAGADLVAGIILKISGAIKTMLATLTAHPLLLLAGGLAAIAGAAIALEKARFDASSVGKYVDKVDSLVEASKDLNDEIATLLKNQKERTTGIENEYGAIKILADKYFDLADQTSLTNDEQLLMKAYADELIGAVPELSSLIDEQTGAYKGTKDEIEALITKTKEYYLVQAAQESLIEIAKAQYKAEKDLKDLEEERKTAVELLADKQAEYNDTIGVGNTNLHTASEEQKEAAKKSNELRTEISALEGTVDSLDTQINTTTGSQQDLNNEWDYATDYITTYSDTAKKEMPKVVTAVNDAYSEIDKAVKDWKLPDLVAAVKVDTSALTEFMKSQTGSNIIDYSMNKYKPKKYATGGFPNTGEAFIARENGIPEMVGKWGNRTAVANNDQIRGGIADAVKGALIEVLVPVIGQIGGSRNNPTIEVPLYLDGEELARGIYNGQQSYEGRMNPVKVGG